MNREEYRVINSLDKIAVTKHARIRLEERGIRMDDIVRAIGNGEIIKEYVDDKPLHLVISRDKEFI